MALFPYSALSRLPPSVLGHLRAFLDDPAALASLRLGRNVGGAHPSLSKAFANLDWEEAESGDALAVQGGIGILAWDDERYPSVLRQIASPPPALYVKGNVEVLEHPAIAVVGSRLSTVYGQNAARMLARDLARSGVVVVSGLARGIDTAAHEGSLDVPGRAVAVLGTGLDVPYPRENKALFMKIIEEQGAVVSEFPLGTPPHPRNFPQRNRVVAGISLGVLLVEATERSGALITARFAIETNREVFAVPHNITSRTGIGPNTLIQKGAKLVQRVEDMLEELPPSLRCTLQPSGPRLSGSTGTVPSNLSPTAQKVLEALRPDEAVNLDALCAASRLAMPEILAGLLDLQMAGLCIELPGARYALKSKN